jgi:threonine synthase
MKYYSLNKQTPDVSFKEAVINGLAPDKGLYFPKTIPTLHKDFFVNIDQYSFHEIAFEVIKPYVTPDIPEDELQKIITDSLNFPIPLVSLEKNLFTLELFHGPTMAFKDIGARFMARCLAYFNKNEETPVTILVATSGDTGSAVANGFLGVNGVDVVILYPKGKVSKIQEKQLTTLGQNITAIEIDGVFDDCQDMVKTAFLDTEITKKRRLTSANSINIARWLPQMFYYFFMYKQLRERTKDIVVSVPSGNFGNICAGMLAQQMGLPIKRFIASVNANKVVPNYLRTRNYVPIRSIQTISNAMDVGNPSNFVRIKELYKQNFELLQQHLTAFSYTDTETKEAMIELHDKYDYTADPHGAVGYLGLKEHLKSDETGIFIETAHPIKFLDVVKEVLKMKLEIPEQIQKVIRKKKVSIPIKTYEELKAFLS